MATAKRLPDNLSPSKLGARTCLLSLVLGPGEEFSLNEMCLCGDCMFSLDGRASAAEGWGTRFRVK